MQFPSFFGIRTLADLTVQKFNDTIQTIDQWWNDHDSGVRVWNMVNTMGITSTIVSKTGNYTATNTDFVILVDSTAGAVTITLPTAVNIPGRWYFVKDWKGQAAAHNITVATTSAQTIDGAASKVFTKPYLGYLFVSDGANWTIESTESVLGNYLPLTGGTMSGNIAMGGNKVTGLGAATGNGDALRYEQLIGLYLLLTGGTMSGAIAMGTNKITGLGNGSAAQDAAAFGQIPSITAGQIVGTATNDNASAGNVGEYIASDGGSGGFAATTVWFDQTSLSLTAGDWNVCAQLVCDNNGGTWSRVDFGVSSTSGNSATGLAFGTNWTVEGWANSLLTPTIKSLSITNYRVSLSTTTTYYFKVRGTFSLGSPSVDGSLIYARRVR